MQFLELGGQSLSTSIRSRFFCIGAMVLFSVSVPVGTAVGQDASNGSEAGDSANGETAVVWNQDAVTKLASELETTLAETYAERLKAPPQETVLQQRKRDAAQGIVRNARDLSRDYASRMRSGLDRNTSALYFRTVVDEVAYIWDTAGDAVPAEAAQPRIDRIQNILKELQAFYDAP